MEEILKFNTSFKQSKMETFLQYRFMELSSIT